MTLSPHRGDGEDTVRYPGGARCAGRIFNPDGIIAAILDLARQSRDGTTACPVEALSA